MPQRFSVSVLSGPVTVAYGRSGRDWLCTALQFDLVGTGHTREEAFNQLRGVLSSYLTSVLGQRGPLKFFNPSERQEWNCEDTEQYRVEVVMAAVHGPRCAPRVIPDIAHLRHYRSQVRAFDLTPVAV